MSKIGTSVSKAKNKKQDIKDLDKKVVQKNETLLTGKLFGVDIGYVISLQPKKAHMDTGKKEVFISMKDFQTRSQFKYESNDYTEKNLAKYNEMQEKDLFFFADTEEKLFEKIKNLYLIRQHYMVINTNGMFIMVGKEANRVDEFQSFIWHNANGKRTVAEIFNIAINQEKPKPEDEPIRVFTRYIVTLVKCSALFLMY